MVTVSRPKNYTSNLETRPEINHRCVLCGRPMPTWLWAVSAIVQEDRVSFYKESKLGNAHLLGSNCLHEHPELRPAYIRWVHPDGPLEVSDEEGKEITE